MRGTLGFVGLLGLLLAFTGCDETMLASLPPDVQAAIEDAGYKLDLVSQPALGDQDQDQLRDQVRQRLHDGSCDGDGSQYRYGQRPGDNGLDGNGGNGGSGGNGGGSGDQVRLRARDGSCQDG